jgi:hypothetical protein
MFSYFCLYHIRCARPSQDRFRKIVEDTGDKLKVEIVLEFYNPLKRVIRQEQNGSTLFCVAPFLSKAPLVANNTYSNYFPLFLYYKNNGIRANIWADNLSY